MNDCCCLQLHIPTKLLHTKQSCRGGTTFGAGRKAWSLSSHSCHQVVTQNPWQLVEGSPHSSYSCPIPSILCFCGGCQPPSISSSTSEPHPCTAYLNPSAEKTFCPEVAQRETYCSPSRLSSLRSRSSRHTSDQHRASMWGYCSGKPGIPGGCGARHLQGWTRRTCSPPPGTDTPVKMGMAATKGCCHGESVSLSFPTW